MMISNSNEIFSTNNSNFVDFWEKKVKLRFIAYVRNWQYNIELLTAWLTVQLTTQLTA